MKDVAKQNLKSFGFNREIERAEKGQCPFCGSTKIERKDFDDELSWEEFKISALCQKCMNDVFNE